MHACMCHVTVILTVTVTVMSMAENALTPTVHRIHAIVRCIQVHKLNTNLWSLQENLRGIRYLEDLEAIGDLGDCND